MQVIIYSFDLFIIIQLITDYVCVLYHFYMVMWNFLLAGVIGAWILLASRKGGCYFSGDAFYCWGYAMTRLYVV